MSALSVTISEAYTQRYEVAAALPMRLARAAMVTLNFGRLCELFADAGPLIQLSGIA
jgi:hypothetical protein